MLPGGDVCTEIKKQISEEGWVVDRGSEWWNDQMERVVRRSVDRNISSRLLSSPCSPRERTIMRVLTLVAIVLVVASCSTPTSFRTFDAGGLTVAGPGRLSFKAHKNSVEEIFIAKAVHQFPMCVTIENRGGCNVTVTLFKAPSGGGPSVEGAGTLVLTGRTTTVCGHGHRVLVRPTASADGEQCSIWWRIDRLTP